MTVGLFHAQAPGGICLRALVVWGLLCAGVTAAGSEPPVPAARAPLAARSLLTAVTSTPAGMLVAAGERGHVLLSHDAGEHWAQAEVPVDVLLTGACFVDDRTGYLVGHDQTILSTQDGGTTWRIEHFAPESGQPFLHVVCSADGAVVAVGAYATLALRHSGEPAFRLQELKAVAPATARRPARMDDDAELEQPHLNVVARSRAGTLYVAGEAGHLYRSEDQGEHWVALPSPYGGSFFTALATGDTSLLVAGLRGHVYRSVDKGQHWTQVVSTTDVLLDGAAVLADGRVVLVGMAGVVLVSDDEGVTFRRLRMADRKGLSAVAVGPRGPVVVGENGVRRLTLGTGK